MKLTHVYAHIDQEAAGPSYSVPRLCEALAAEGEEVELHTMAARKALCGVKLVVHGEWRPLGRFGFSLELVRSLRSAADKADVIHTHSLWAFPNMAAGIVAPGRRASLVTSPRGTLAPAALKRSAWKKRIFKPLQWPVVARAACLHATSKMEYVDIRNHGLTSPIAVIPNGIDIPDLSAYAGVGVSTASMRRVLFLGRLHPIKGVELLLKAWSALQGNHPDWELVVAGNGDPAYVQSLRDMAARLKLERVGFPGPVYGEDKGRLYVSSDLFVLPTQTENFGIAIAEAQAHAVPVITTRGAPWKGLVDNASGWWVERIQDDIAAAMDEAMCMDAMALAVMGMRGRTWMESDYDWATVARKTSAVYRWLREGGKAPDCIRLG